MRWREATGTECRSKDEPAASCSGTREQRGAPKMAAHPTRAAGAPWPTRTARPAAPAQGPAPGRQAPAQQGRPQMRHGRRQGAACSRGAAHQHGRATTTAQHSQQPTAHLRRERPGSHQRQRGAPAQQQRALQDDAQQRVVASAVGLPTECIHAAGHAYDPAGGWWVSGARGNQGRLALCLNPEAHGSRGPQPVRLLTGRGR